MVLKTWITYLLKKWEGNDSHCPHGDGVALTGGRS